MFLKSHTDSQTNKGTGGDCQAPPKPGQNQDKLQKPGACDLKEGQHSCASQSHLCPACKAIPHALQSKTQSGCAGFWCSAQTLLWISHQNCSITSSGWQQKSTETLRWLLQQGGCFGTSGICSPEIKKALRGIWTPDLQLTRFGKVLPL